jgi:transposase-like protein
MPGRIYTAEEKYSIIMEAFQNPNITIASICREHGIAVSLFYKWRDQFLEGGKKGLEGKDPDKALTKEVENLKSIIGEMTIANEILKKNYMKRKRGVQ